MSTPHLSDVAGIIFQDKGGGVDLLEAVVRLPPIPDSLQPGALVIRYLDLAAKIIQEFEKNQGPEIDVFFGFLNSTEYNAYSRVFAPNKFALGLPMALLARMIPLFSHLCTTRSYGMFPIENDKKTEDFLGLFDATGYRSAAIKEAKVMERLFNQSTMAGSPYMDSVHDLYLFKKIDDACDYDSRVLTEIAVNYVVWHELGHILENHLAYTKGQHGISEWRESGWDDRSMDAGLRQGFEFLADDFAAFKIIEGVYPCMLLQADKIWFDPFEFGCGELLQRSQVGHQKHFSEPLKVYFYQVAYAVRATIYSMDLESQRLSDYKHLGHPHPELRYARFEVVIGWLLRRYTNDAIYQMWVDATLSASLTLQFGLRALTGNATGFWLTEEGAATGGDVAQGGRIVARAAKQSSLAWAKIANLRYQVGELNRYFTQESQIDYPDKVYG